MQSIPFKKRKRKHKKKTAAGLFVAAMTSNKTTPKSAPKSTPLLISVKSNADLARATNTSSSGSFSRSSSLDRKESINREDVMNAAQAKIKQCAEQRANSHKVGCQSIQWATRVKYNKDRDVYQFMSGFAWKHHRTIAEHVSQQMNKNYSFPVGDGPNRGIMFSNFANRVYEFRVPEDMKHTDTYSHIVANSPCDNLFDVGHIFSSDQFMKVHDTIADFCGVDLK